MQANQGGRLTPAPIFNHKKRQRQAMFADPQSSGTSTNSTSCPDLMPVDGFNRRSQNANAFSYNQFSRNNAGDRSQLNNSGANNIFIQQGKTKYNNTANQQRSNQQSISRGSGGGNKYRFGGSNQPGSSNAATLTQPQRGQSHGYIFNSNMDKVFDSNMEDEFAGNHSSNQQGLPRNTSTQSNQYNQRQQTRGGVNTSGMSNQASYRGRVQASSTSSMSSWGGAPAQCNPVAACPVPQQLPAYPVPQQLPAYPQSSKNQQSLATNLQQNQKMFQNPTKSATQRSNQNKKAKIDEVDKSLKVLTLTTSSIKKFHQMNIQLCPVIFEVFGIIDSAVLRDKMGSGKEFLLRDEEDKLQCVFYEIDRELPRLIRGQWHRCVGSVDSRTGFLKCVSVRPASTEDRQMAKSVRQASEKKLTSFIHHNREP